MSVVATSAANWNEDDEPDWLVAAIEKIVAMKFGPTEPALLREVRCITDPDRLRQIVDLACSATHFADIQAAIESAVPPPPK